MIFFLDMIGTSLYKNSTKLANFVVDVNYDTVPWRIMSSSFVMGTGGNIAPQPLDDTVFSMFFWLNFLKILLKLPIHICVFFALSVKPNTIRALHIAGGMGIICGIKPGQ